MKRLFLVVLLAACSKVDDNARTVVVGPDRAQFVPVQSWLEHRCGSLDCHGNFYRNLRIWGQDGMRLAVGDVPGGAPTTGAEIEATYQSVVELEPEKMALVVTEHGADPNRLTFIRKPRGLEKHVGNTVMAPGDARDQCVVTWLAGAVDGAACSEALTLP